MDVIIRLYCRHDSDLINIHNNKEYSLASAMRDSVIAYVRKQPIKLVMPVPYLEKEVAKKNVGLHLYFHPEEEEDVINFLLGVREGHRCAMIKNIFRGYLMYPNVYNSFENKEEALAHARDVYTDTEQKLTESGQEFARGRGNRGIRKTEEWEGKKSKKKENAKVSKKEEQKAKPDEQKVKIMQNEILERFASDSSDMNNVMSEDESQALFKMFGDVFC